VLIRLAVFVSFAWQAGRTGTGHHRPFPRTLADQLGLDPVSLADQLSSSTANAPAELLTSRCTTADQRSRIPVSFWHQLEQLHEQATPWPIC
jgi:hypothetical protein